MLGYTTEINFVRNEVKVTFLREEHTFVFDNLRLPLVESLRVSAEFMACRIHKFLADAADAADAFPTCPDCEKPLTGPHAHGPKQLISEPTDAGRN